ncbi:glycosyltransferase family 4 protein [Schleiferiaceae bacterium]|nr:glycosyltransferase family 4 protein [Schleiferiaceae bacterium]
MKPVKRILFLTDNFPPEVNAPATRTYEHAREWVGKGYEVTVLTSYPNFPQGKVYEGFVQKLIESSEIEGIKVIRVATIIYPNSGFVKRIIDQLSYAIMAFLVGIWVRTDTIVATSPQFFTAVAGRWLSFFKVKPWIMEVRDLWPESIAAVGAINEGRIYKFLEWVEIRLYKSAKKIIVVTDTFKRKIAARGIDESKIDVHKNGVILDLYEPRTKDNELMEANPQFHGKKVFAYIGTLGMAHGLSFILNSLSKLQESLPQAHFLFIGEGAEKENLLKQAEDLKLTNVTFMPFVPKHEVVRYLSLMDVALVNLKKSDTFKTVIPSKIFEAAALQKPILLGLEGETKGIIESFNSGTCFEPENEEEFILKCHEILQEKQYADFQKGCKNLAEAFNRKKIALQVLETITTD